MVGKDPHMPPTPALPTPELPALVNTAIVLLAAGGVLTLGIAVLIWGWLPAIDRDLLVLLGVQFLLHVYGAVLFLRGTFTCYWEIMCLQGMTCLIYGGGGISLALVGLRHGAHGVEMLLLVLALLYALVGAATLIVITRPALRALFPIEELTMFSAEEEDTSEPEMLNAPPVETFRMSGKEGGEK
jgi:hypothetical protein